MVQLASTMNLRRWEHNTASSIVHEGPIRGPGKARADIELTRPAVYGKTLIPLLGATQVPKPGCGCTARHLPLNCVKQSAAWQLSTKSPSELPELQPESKC